MKKIGAVIIWNKRILLTKKSDEWNLPYSILKKTEKDITCLRRGIKRDLSVKLVSADLLETYEYKSNFLNQKDKMKIYNIIIEGEPQTSSEIVFVDSKHNLNVNPLVGLQLIPHLVQRGWME